MNMGALLKNLETQMGVAGLIYESKFIKIFFM